MKCHDLQELLSGYVDGELTQQESQRVRLHLELCNDCTKLHDELVVMKENLGELSYPGADLKALEEIENDLVSSNGQWLGWGLLLLAFLILAGNGLYEIFTADDVPWSLRLSTTGFIVLFVIVLRQRLKSYKNDKYRKVKL